MVDVFFGVMINLVFFAAIGIGPALCLLSAGRRIEIALAIAPTLGFALTCVGGTWLISLDYPVSVWLLPWVAVSSAVSLGACLLAAGMGRLDFKRVHWRLVLLNAGGLGLALIMALAPMLIGGLHFTTLRGNGTDTLNYISAAVYLDQEPFSWASSVTRKILINQHPAYDIALQLLDTRWATFMMLTAAARIAAVPIHRFEYGFCVLSFLLAFGVIFWLGVMGRLRSVLACTVAIAVCVGFWAQLVLDIKAMSQMNSIPLLLLLVFLVARVERRSTLLSVGDGLLIATTFAALLLSYLEITPLLALGAVLFWGMRLLKKQSSLTKTLRYCVPLSITVVIVWPAAPMLMHFLIQQTQIAMEAPTRWASAYFSWFYANPLIGLWGLSPYRDWGRSLSSRLTKWSLWLLSGILSFFLISFVVQAFFMKERSAVRSMLAAFVAATFVQFLYLYGRAQYWAAGKGLAFGYPFVMIGVAFALSRPALCGSRAGLRYG